MAEVPLERVAEAMDHLVRVPIANWAIIKGLPLDKLYDSARVHAGAPLSLAAGKLLLESCQPGRPVLMLSGFIIKDFMRPETDGPIGAAALGRAIALGTGATPIGICEKVCLPAYDAVFRASGLVPAEMSSWHRGRNRYVVLPFTLDGDKAMEDATRLLDDAEPSAVIAVERPGGNRVGVYHGGGGFDISPWTAKTDAIFSLARERGIPTIGIGDLGNELGMGTIADTVRAHVEYGARCECPCGAGIAAAESSDVAVIANVSNWGAYAIAAWMAAALGNDEIFHTPELELRLIDECVRGGAIDPVGGQLRSYVDGTSAATNAAIVELLAGIVRLATTDAPELSRYRDSWVDR